MHPDYASYKVVCLPSSDPVEVTDTLLRRVEFNFDAPRHVDPAAIYHEAVARAPTGFYVASMSALEWTPRWRRLRRLPNRSKWK